MGRSLIAMLVALTTTACVSEAPGSPVPGPSDSDTPPSASESPTGEAPPINSPELDLASYEDRVCDLLSLDQLAPFAIRTPGRIGDDIAGPSCVWDPPDSGAGARVSVAVLSKAQNGWEGVYERRDRYVFFEEAGEINGYPAVHVDVTTVGTKQGICTTVAGVRRDLVFQAVVFVNRRESPEYKDPCSVSDRVAGLVIDTLRGGR